MASMPSRRETSVAPTTGDDYSFEPSQRKTEVVCDGVSVTFVKTVLESESDKVSKSPTNPVRVPKGPPPGFVLNINRMIASNDRNIKPFPHPRKQLLSTSVSNFVPSANRDLIELPEDLLVDVSQNELSSCTNVALPLIENVSTKVEMQSYKDMWELMEGQT
jgi:hypothetical protein